MANIPTENMAVLLAMLKNNLQLMTDWMDEEAKTAKETELSQYIKASANFIEREGITLDFSQIDDELLVVMYSSWLYEKRLNGVSVMPRMLRINLNNRVFSEKLRSDDA